MSSAKPFSDLVDVLQRSVETHGDRDLFGTKVDGRWQWISYRDFGKRVDDFRGGLAQLGIGAGDTVAVISNNRVEWAIAAYAAYGLGARLCPMYETQLAEDWRYIVEDSGAKLLFVATYPIYETTQDWGGNVGQLERVYCMSVPEEDESSFGSVEVLGRNNPTPVAELDSEGICGFIYTSGTTGKPKGVLLSHNNIVSNLNAVQQLFPVGPGDVSVSFLPWAHSFGQTCELHLMLSKGAALALAESIEKLVDNFGEVRPTVLFSVPRIFNRIYDGLQKKIAEEGGLKKALFDAGLANAERRAQLAADGRSSGLVELKHRFFDRLVFSKVRARFGGRLRYAVSGGAALSTEVAEFIDKLGIVVCEGYGLTETSPITSTNHPGERRMGSVGRPIPGVEVIIDTSVVEDADSQDGEILVKGPNVMVGYHNRPEETAEVMREDGAFRTGDLGRMMDGFLYITGRIKEQYKLQNGKYVVPAPLEELLQLSPYISQAYLDGANQPYNVTLLVPDRLAVEKWAGEQGLEGDYESLLQHDKAQALFAQELEHVTREFKSYERPKKFALISEEFSVANGMLTPKMSLKRLKVIERYSGELERLHG